MRRGRIEEEVWGVGVELSLCGERGVVGLIVEVN